MEGTPRNENVENLDAWRDLKQQAPEQAKALIAEIEDFDDLHEDEQLEKLQSLLESLEGDNANRFVVEVIAHRMSFIGELQRHERRLTELGIAA